MAKCPRCALAVPAYERCARCGLVLGFEGITLLIEFEGTLSPPNGHRVSKATNAVAEPRRAGEAAYAARCAVVRRLARQRSSYSEWVEENGRHFLRVTYRLDELDEFRRIAAVAAHLARKQVFLNGLEVRWPEGTDWEWLPEIPASIAALHSARTQPSSN